MNLNFPQCSQSVYYYKDWAKKERQVEAGKQPNRRFQPSEAEQIWTSSRNGVVQEGCDLGKRQQYEHVEVTLSVCV